MEEIELMELKEKAKAILRNNSIQVLNGEKDLVERLNKIINEEDNCNDYNLINKSIEYIQMYLEYKEKIQLAQKDYKYLSYLSEELRNQEIRRTDAILNIPLFKIMSKDRKEKYFLTRNGAKEYIELYKDRYINKIIEIEESDNTDLIKVIEIIKRNF